MVLMLSQLGPAITQLSSSNTLAERHVWTLSQGRPFRGPRKSEERASKEFGELNNSVINAEQSVSTSGLHIPPKRKRKRNIEDNDIEAIYLERITKEDSKTSAEIEAASSFKRRKSSTLDSPIDGRGGYDTDDPNSSSIESSERKNGDETRIKLPQHETLALSGKALELEKAARTVFLANVATMCIKSKTAKKTLLNHLSSFCSSLPAASKPHKVDSLRFRSTPFSTGSGPRKAAYAKREIMDATARSTNAYVVYTSQVAAREAVKRLNGTMILDRHLLADSIAHPRKIDHRKCVFIGNLDFVNDESQINAAKAENQNSRPRKSRGPSDVEEGLWREFSKVGVIESVRVIRDGKTRVGKGFAYVQFKVRISIVHLLCQYLSYWIQDDIAVEKALLYNDKKFPPLLPRTMRVSRAKKMTKTSMRKSQHVNKGMSTKPALVVAGYTPESDPSSQSLSGRAGKLLGRAGAARLKGTFSVSDKQPSKGPGSIAKGPEQIVFEGYRASSKRSRGAKFGGSGKKQGKPQTRSSRRGAAFKAKGGRKI